jgi:hypothetical protein
MTQATKTTITGSLVGGLPTHSPTRTDLESWENLSRLLSKAERLGSPWTEDLKREPTQSHQHLWVLFDREGAVQDILAFVTPTASLPTPASEALFQKALRSPVVWIQGATASQYFQWLENSTTQQEPLKEFDQSIRSFIEAVTESDLDNDRWSLPYDPFSTLRERLDTEDTGEDELYVHPKMEFARDPIPRFRRPIQLTPRTRYAIPPQKLPRTFNIPLPEGPED